MGNLIISKKINAIITRKIPTDQNSSSGANSKVKLGYDKDGNRYYAVKILKKGNPNLDHKFLDLVMTEVQTMSQLNHLNIVNLIEYSKDGIVEKSNG